MISFFAIQLLVFIFLIDYVMGCKLIKNIDLLSCKHCRHFIPDYYSSTSYSKCKMFGEKNIITDEINYDYANSCREDELKCGINAIYFERENQTILSLKTLKHSISNPKNILMVAFVTYLITVMSLVLRH